ncbi:hypothetical protein AAG570_009665 [Ranatra chinensis]|uniref:Uncharacterized protein n=1 Tax=Ranatra chinensis TaxID=642074 RepID=A0ABD0YPP9_9HEMI
MASKRRNMFYENKKQGTTDIPNTHDFDRVDPTGVEDSRAGPKSATVPPAPVRSLLSCSPHSTTEGCVASSPPDVGTIVSHVTAASRALLEAIVNLREPLSPPLSRAASSAILNAHEYSLLGLYMQPVDSVDSNAGNVFSTSGDTDRTKGWQIARTYFRRLLLLVLVERVPDATYSLRCVLYYCGGVQAPKHFLREQEAGDDGNRCRVSLRSDLVGSPNNWRNLLPVRPSSDGREVAELWNYGTNR